MQAGEHELDLRGSSGQVSETPFDADRLSTDVVKRLTGERYAWLTTVNGAGMPVPMLVWFHFDGSTLTVYSQPRAARVTHIFEHPAVSLHLESDGVGSDLVIVGGNAAVTAQWVDPRDDHRFWAKYHLEADLTGLSETIAKYSTRITITPATVWTTSPQ